MMKAHSKLLIDEPPLQVLPTLAVLIGLNEAIVLQQIHYWIKIAEQSKDKRKLRDRRWWVYNSYREWHENNFQFWSQVTVKRTILSLEKKGLVISEQPNASDWDQKKWYTIDYETLDDLIDGINMTQSTDAERTDGEAQDDPLLIESENTPETSSIPPDDPLSPSTPGGCKLIARLQLEAGAKNRTGPKKFETIAQRDKFLEAEAKMTPDELDSAITAAMVAGATSRGRAVNYIAAVSTKVRPQYSNGNGHRSQNAKAYPIPDGV